MMTPRRLLLAYCALLAAVVESDESPTSPSPSSSRAAPSFLFVTGFRLPPARDRAVRRRRLPSSPSSSSSSSSSSRRGIHLLSSSSPSSSTLRLELRSPAANDRAHDDDGATTMTSGDDDDVVVVGDRAPCFDNGVCLSFPETDDGDDGDDGLTDTTTPRKNDRDRPRRAATAAAAVVPSETDDDDPDPDPDLDDYAISGGAMRRLGPGVGPTVWSEFGRLARESQESGREIANLGQGFPDWSPPNFAVESLVSAATDTSSSRFSSSPHQYTRTAGHPSLVGQLARRYSRHMGRIIDPMAEVAVTVGASQALYLCLQALVEPGVCDEVVLFEPFFDLYANQIRLAGGIPVYVPLTFVPPASSGGGEKGGGGGTWILESDRLRAKMSSTKTCAVILNSPHNPTGKVFTHAEMLAISRIVSNDAGPRCVVISDEVYKYIVHSPPKEEEGGDDDDDDDDAGVGGAGGVDGVVVRGGGNGRTASCPGHVHFASLPNMWDRTITVSSAGKTFSATGWQVGWCVGPSRLISPIHRLLPYVQFCASTVMQEALARTLPRADEPYMGHENYYDYLNDKYRRKRDLLARALEDVGFEVPDYGSNPGWGGFFIFARITPRVREALPSHRLEAPLSINAAAPGGEARLDWALCQWMAEEKGVLCIPSSPFFSRERALEGASDEFIRVAFCKTDETIERAAVALRGLTSLAGEVSDGDDEDVDAGVVISEGPVAGLLAVDENVVVNRMG